MRQLIRLYRDAFSDLTPTVWLLSLGGLINRAGTMVMPFMTLYLISEKGYSLEQASWVLFAFGLGSVAGSFLGGKACARLGFMPILIGSLLSSGLGFVLLGYADQFKTLLAGFFLVSLFGDAFRPAIMTALSFHGRNQVAKSMALLRLAINLGMAIGPALGGFLAHKSFRLLFWVDGVTCILAGIFMWSLIDRLTPSETKAHAGSEEHVPERPLPIWKEPPFMFFLFIIMGLAFCFFQLLGAYPLYLKQVFEFQESQIGTIIGLNALVIALTEMVLIHKIRNRPTIDMFALGILLVGLGFGLLPICLWSMGQPIIQMSLLVLLTLTWTIGEMLALPLANTLVANYANGKHTGHYMAWYTSAFALAMLISPPLGLRIMDRWGPNAIWWVVTLLGLLLPLLALKMRKWFRHSHTETKET